ncbi:MAG: alpha/beta fold hydrolase [Acidimicrobiales bacterium]
MTSRPDHLQHRLTVANGIRIHLVEAGTGPMVLLVHGFPESWYSWRHQLPVLARAGYRAVAIDVRGYGQSSKPTPTESYRMMAHVADNLGVVSALGAGEAVIIGHDWGSPIAATSALLRPDVFRAVGLLSVPYAQRGHRRPTESFKKLGGAEEFYINYFQQPGRAEAEIEQDVAGWLAGFYLAASGDAQPCPDGGSIATVKTGGQLRDRFADPFIRPSWLSQEDLDFYVAEFCHSGFTGGLNRYRNVDRDWEDLAFCADAPIEVPSLFIGGDRDGPTLWGAASIAGFGTTLPRLWGSHILEGCGHWTQQERAEEVNELLLAFLASLT